MSDLFPKLEPPRGGLASLRARLDATERRVRVRRRLLAAASVVIAAATVVSAVSRHRRGSGTPLALLAPPDHPVVARDGSSVEPVSASDAVVFYRVASVEE